MTDKLMPCPFCGGQAELVEGEECAYVQCLDMKMHRAMFVDGDNNAAAEALEQWNRRADLAAAPQPKVIGKLGWGSEMAAPQPSPVDREALVEVIREINDDWIASDSRPSSRPEFIANALLARGLRLPVEPQAAEPLIEEIVSRVSEWDDRTSPEDWPEALLITANELREELRGLARALLAERDALQGQLNDLRNGWANSVKAHAALLAERDAAFAAGQEEMRERAAERCDCALMDWEGDVLHDRARAIRDLPIKPRP